MLLNNYMKGKGVQYSKKSNFPLLLNINTPLDNFFTLSNNFQESLDFFYTQNIINTTKYNRILYQESIISLKKGGFFIVNTDNLTTKEISKIKKEILLVAKGKYVFQDKISGYMVFKKIKNYLKPSDNIDSWSFGIISNGSRDDYIKKFISSVETQKIPKYEILICGKLESQDWLKYHKNVKFIFFDKKSDKGWITKKKNVICENVRYENMVIVHDRFFLDKNWFKGMKKYGNYFEVLCFEQFLDDYKMGWSAYGGNRYPGFDFFAMIRPIDKLHPSDWSPRICAHGGVSTLKRSIWEDAKWDEKLFWNEKDDIELSFREFDKGIMTRLNPYSKINISYSRVGLHHLFLKKNKRKDNFVFWQGPIKEKLFYRFIVLKQLILSSIYFIFRVDLTNINFKEEIKKKIIQNK